MFALTLAPWVCQGYAKAIGCTGFRAGIQLQQQHQRCGEWAEEITFSLKDAHRHPSMECLKRQDFISCTLAEPKSSSSLHLLRNIFYSQDPTFPSFLRGDQNFQGSEPKIGYQMGCNMERYWVSQITLTLSSLVLKQRETLYEAHVLHVQATTIFGARLLQMVDNTCCLHFLDYHSPRTL